jgi:hypothetical protein
MSYFDERRRKFKERAKNYFKGIILVFSIGAALKIIAAALNKEEYVNVTFNSVSIIFLWVLGVSIVLSLVCAGIEYLYDEIGEDT